MVKLFSSIDINDENERLIGGWASLEIVDRQGDIVPIPELEKSMIKLMDRGGYIFYGHQNKPVGKILKWEVKEHPDLGVQGVYIIAKIFNDYELDNEVWGLIKQGKLSGFSIGGRSNKQDWAVAKDDKNKKVRILKDIELGEISIVSEPANPYARLEEVNYFAKGSNEEIDKGMEDDDMQSQDYVDEIEGNIVEKDGKWQVVADDGLVLKSFDEKGDAIEFVEELSNSEGGISLLKYGKKFLDVVGGNKIYVMKKGNLNFGDDNMSKIKIYSYGVDDKVAKSVVKGLINHLVDLYKDEKDRYMEGKHFKEMTCPDSNDKSRFCGCVRYQMSQGKSLESAKKICGYIKVYVKKGSFKKDNNNKVRVEITRKDGHKQHYWISRDKLQQKRKEVESQGGKLKVEGEENNGDNEENEVDVKQETETRHYNNENDIWNGINVDRKTIESKVGKVKERIDIIGSGMGDNLYMGFAPNSMVMRVNGKGGVCNYLNESIDIPSDMIDSIRISTWFLEKGLDIKLKKNVKPNLKILVGEKGVYGLFNIDNKEDMVKKGSVEILKPNDLRPPKKWWDRCMNETGNAKLCGWVFYHRLKTKKPKDEGKENPETRGARRRKKEWEENRKV